MAVTTANSGSATAIRPFTIDVPESDLEDLRARIAATRWPEKETVDDPAQGVQLATMQALAHYGETEHDWHKCEAKLNSVPNFITDCEAPRPLLAVLAPAHNPGAPVAVHAHRPTPRLRCSHRCSHVVSNVFPRSQRRGRHQHHEREKP